MQTVTFGQSSFECSDVSIETPAPTNSFESHNLSFQVSFASEALLLSADHHFAIYLDGKHVGDLHDATLEGSTLRGLFVHA